MRTLLLTLALLLSTSTIARTLKVDSKRIISVIGGVDGTIIKQAHQLEKFTLQSKDPIYIVINSPGGYVIAGIQFINALKLVKARKVKLICIVPVVAASMAMHFLAYCDKRYVFEDTLLLWHPAKLSGCGTLTGKQLIAQAQQLAMYEDKLNERLIRKMRINKKLFWKHYERETLWTADALAKKTFKFLTIIHDIKGINGLFTLEKKKKVAPWMRLIMKTERCRGEK